MTAWCTDQDQIILQRDLDNLQVWVHLWGMRFNPQKCYIMNISRCQLLTKAYELCGVVLQSVASAKYLGVSISQDLSWHNHVCSVAQRANATLHFISRNLKYCPRQTRELAYCSLVRSSMEYCAGVWDPYQQQDKQMLEKVNRRAARVVFNRRWRDRDVSPTALLKELKWRPLEDRRRQQRMCMMYKISHNLIAVPPTRLQPPTRTTRGHQYKYQTIRTTCDKVRFAFYPRSIPEWNNLSEATVNAPSLDSFQARLANP